MGRSSPLVRLDCSSCTSSNPQKIGIYEKSFGRISHKVVKVCCPHLLFPPPAAINKLKTKTKKDTDIRSPE